MDSYGEILRKAREEKNLNVEKIAREISIESRYLTGLEEEDNGVFPGEAYMIGFLRNYSNYLELDTDYILRLYNNKKIQESPVPEGLLVKRRPRWLIPAIVIPIVLIVGTIATISILLATKKNVEDDDSEHRKRFENTLKEMREAEKLGKTIKFDLGYSNIDFELWIILHKKDLFGSVGSKQQYLKIINQIFETRFESLKRYKEERNFEQILSKITLDDIKSAIERAEKIERQRKVERNPNKSFGYEWFDKNPSLSVHAVVRKILSECGV